MLSNVKKFMLLTHITHSFRRFRKGRVYTILNTTGLTAGLSAALMIFLWIAHETSYDKNWPDASLIYRVSEEIDYNNGNHDRFAVSSFPLGPSLKSHIPSVEDYCRISYSTGARRVWKKGASYSIDNIQLVDTNFLSFFPYPVVLGNGDKALKEPGNIIISKEIAGRIFGDGNPLGSILKIGRKNYAVQAVIDTRSITSHLDPEILIPNTIYSNETVEGYNRDWTRMVNFTYLKFKNEPDLHKIRDQIKKWNDKVIGDWINQNELSWNLDFKLHPLKNVHFTKDLQYDVEGNNDYRFIYIFGTIAVFILLLAAINYINLSTARAIKRARETGIRKVVGATRGGLIRLYLSEAIVNSFIAFALALVLAEILLPYFSHITGNDNLMLSYFNKWQWMMAIAGVLLIGLLSGFLPAFVLSSFKPVDTLKGASVPTAGSSSGGLQLLLRKTLIVFQFFVSTALIFSTLVVYSQMNFMKKSDTGYDRDHVMVFKIPHDSAIGSKLNDMRSRFLQNPSVINVSSSHHIPSRKPGRLTFYIDRDGEWEQQMLSLYIVDHHFADLMGIPMFQGRFFDQKHKTDAEKAIVLNQSAVDMLGWSEDPLGNRMACGLGVDGKVIGVIKDFHFTSLHKPIQPMALLLLPHLRQYMLVRISPNDFKNTVQEVNAEWQDFIGKYPSEYFFLDQDLLSVYQKDENLFDLFTGFSILGLAISLLGLIGLVVYTAEQKTREIGIRKTMGANISQIMIEISRSYFFWLLAGILLSWPVSWLLMDQWLSDFAYRISLHPAYYLLAGIISIALSLLAVGFITYRAARTNPVNALRYE